MRPRSSSSRSPTDARFPALQAGEIDVLVRNTTWTASRDGNDGANFLHPTFYDGQQMMVAADSGYASIDDMDGAVVCVAAGTTTEGNVATEFAARGLTVDVQSFEDIDLVQEAFIAGQCDGWSSDGSQLASRRANYPDGPDALVIFEDVFSKEPLTPAVIDGDTQWAQAVEWAIFATIQAEELGHHVGRRPKPTPRATTPPRCSSSAGRAPTATSSTPVSACRPTSPCRSSPRSATTARSSSATCRRSASPSAA